MKLEQASWIGTDISANQHARRLRAHEYKQQSTIKLNKTRQTIKKTLNKVKTKQDKTAFPSRKRPKIGPKHKLLRRGLKQQSDPQDRSRYTYSADNTATTSFHDSWSKKRDKTVTL